MNKLEEAKEIIQSLVPSLQVTSITTSTRTIGCLPNAKYKIIHLEDVMQALEAKTDKSCYQCRFLVKSGGSIEEYDINHGCYFFEADYDTSKPFTQQSEPFYEFLIEVLKEDK